MLDMSAIVKRKEDAGRVNLLFASELITRLLSRPLVNIRPKLLLPSNRCYSKATCRWGLSLLTAGNIFLQNLRRQKSCLIETKGRS